VPVDVERRGVRRTLAPFQYVEPPRIVGEMHPDMVRDKVEDQAEIVRLQRGAQSLKAGFTAELRIEFGVVDYVVAMGAALPRFQERRGVDVADAERLQVGGHGGGGVEAEISRQLQAIGRNGNACRHYLSDAPEYGPGWEVPVQLVAPDRSSRDFPGGVGDVLLRQIGQQPQRLAVAHAPLGGEQAAARRLRAAKGG